MQIKEHKILGKIVRTYLVEKKNVLQAAIDELSNPGSRKLIAPIKLGRLNINHHHRKPFSKGDKLCVRVSNQIFTVKGFRLLIDDNNIELFWLLIDQHEHNGWKHEDWR